MLGQMVMKLTVQLLVVASVAVLCTAWDYHSNLQLTAISYDQITGTFSDYGSGKGVHFISTVNSLVISNLNNQILVEIGSPVADLDNEDMYRLVEIKGRYFLDHRSKGGERKGFNITGEEATYLKIWGNPNTILQSAEAKDMEAHKASIREAITDLIMDSHSQLIVRAAEAMGKGEGGITGKDYPPIMPFYLFAMRLHSLVEADTHTDNQEEGTSIHYGYINPRKYRKCIQQCPPCPRDDCIGMCGPKCTCWRYVCGDCCYHPGCFQHDLCCRAHGKMSLQCLALWRFSCDHYWC